MSLPALPDAGTLKGTSAFYQIEKTSGSFEYVAFSNVQTKSIDVKPLKEATKTDQIGNSVSITFTGIASTYVDDAGSSRTGVNSFYAPEFGSLSNPNDIRTRTSGVNTDAGAVEGILRILSSNRGRFLYKIGDTVLYDIAPRMTHAGSTLSGYAGSGSLVGLAVNQTPTVSASVSRIIGDGTVYVDVTVQFDYVRCTSESNRDSSQKYANNVKSLRWYYADDIDTTSWLTTRLFRGRLEVYDRDVNVQLLRYLVLPPLQLGFRRANIHLRESAAGMTLDFEGPDQDVYAVPPYPLSKWTGTTVVNFPRLLIGKADVSCDLSINAPKPTPKMLLVAWAMRIIDAKIHWYNSVSYGKSVFTTKFSIADKLEEQGIDMSVRLDFILPKVFSSQGRVFGQNPIIKTADAIFRNNLTFHPERRVYLGSEGPQQPEGPQNPYEPPWSSNDAPTLGHSRGIPLYDPQFTPYWFPSNHTLYGIFYCALQNPCDFHLNAPAFADPSNAPEAFPGKQNKKYGKGGRASGGGGERPDIGGDDAMLMPAPGDGQASLFPYTQYEIQTVMQTDMGIKTFSPMNNIKTLTGDNASRIIHQSNSPTETVTMLLDAKRMGRWPNGPNELSFKDPETGIYYICESVTTIASSAIQDALRSTTEYSLKAVVKYQLSRHHKHTEDKIVFTPPFIEEASQQDPNLASSLRAYYESKYSKSGLQFRPGGRTEDSGSTEPPPSDGGGGGDTPLPLY